MTAQRAIPCLFLRGGTSRGPFFHRADLPVDVATRDRVLLAVMGSPDRRQIDGLGGGHPLTSKVGIVARGAAPDDLEFLFAQLQPEGDTVDTTPNCGNMLAAVVPFALETGLVAPHGDTSTFRVRTLNTGMACDITVQTPGGRLRYDGAARIDGVPGTAAPILIDFLDTAGSVCAGLLPTGRPADTIDLPGVGAVRVTCIDNGMPVVVLRARDLGVSGYETPQDLEKNKELKARVESIRLQIGPKMNLGDVTKKVVPKMALIAPARAGGHVCTRTFIPHDVHAAIGVLGAVSVATACILPGSAAQGIATVPEGRVKRMSVEHPTGEFSVTLEVGGTREQPKVLKAGLLRTARLIMRGEVLVPADVWDGAR